MFMSSVFMGLIMAGILTMSLLHLPLFLKRLFYYTPAWLTSAILHFGYGSWLGALTGHLLGACLSVPMYFILRYYLQPKFAGEIDEAWNENWFNVYFWIPISNRISQLYDMFFPPTMIEVV